MLTCLSTQSRNFRFGFSLAQGKDPDPKNPLAEGFFAASALHQRAHALGLTLPALQTLVSVLSHREDYKTFIPQLVRFS